MFTCEILERKHENDFYITFPEEYISEDSFEVTNATKNSNSNVAIVSSEMSTPSNSITENWKKKHFTMIACY